MEIGNDTLRIAILNGMKGREGIEIEIEANLLVLGVDATTIATDYTDDDEDDDDDDKRDTQYR